VTGSSDACAANAASAALASVQAHDTMTCHFNRCTVVPIAKTRLGYFACQRPCLAVMYDPTA
jgi:hypothetical protein